MRPNTIHMQTKNTLGVQYPDWFDEIHDPVIIVLDRDQEENGFSPQP